MSMTDKTKRRDWGEVMSVIADDVCEDIDVNCRVPKEGKTPITCPVSQDPIKYWCTPCIAKEMARRLIEIDGEEKPMSDTKRRDWGAYPMDVFGYCEGLSPLKLVNDSEGLPIDCRKLGEPIETWCQRCVAHEMRSRLLEIDGEEAESK